MFCKEFDRLNKWRATSCPRPSQFNHIKRNYGTLKFNDVSDDDKCLHLGKWFNPLLQRTPSRASSSTISIRFFMFSIRNIFFFFVYLFLHVPHSNTDCHASHLLLLSLSMLPSTTGFPHPEKIWKKNEKPNETDFKHLLCFKLNKAGRWLEWFWRISFDGTFALGNNLFSCVSSSKIIGLNNVKKRRNLWDHSFVHFALRMCLSWKWKGCLIQLTRQYLSHRWCEYSWCTQWKNGNKKCFFFLLSPSPSLCVALTKPLNFNISF